VPTTLQHAICAGRSELSSDTDCFGRIDPAV